MSLTDGTLLYLNLVHITIETYWWHQVITLQLFYNNLPLAPRYPMYIPLDSLAFFFIKPVLLSSSLSRWQTHHVKSSFFLHCLGDTSCLFGVHFLFHALQTSLSFSCTTGLCIQSPAYLRESFCRYRCDFTEGRIQHPHDICHPTLRGNMLYQSIT